MNGFSPEQLGLDAARWDGACEFAQSLCHEDRTPAIAICVGTAEGCLPPVLLGSHRLEADSPPLRDDAIFLVASITKPIVATAAMILIERGQLALADRVADILPDFAGSGRYGITLRHLLTHTSGLPDMLENNIELRKAHSPLSAFVEGTCRVDPDFPAGRGVQYQSMGFAVLGEIIARTTGQTCAEFLHDEVFTKLAMYNTALGAPESWFAGESPKVDRIPEIRLPDGQKADDTWHWNSPYWRSLGAPWGGMLTTPQDLATFARMMLNDGELHGVRILGPASIAAATRNQLAPMRHIPEIDRRCRPWGLGWRLDWPAHGANFGDLLGPATYGHWGATGTVLWIDPALDAFAVILTTQPQEPHGRLLAKLSNLIAPAFV